MAKLDLLRKLIREEVRSVFQEELAGILKEAIIANKGQHQITESARPVVKTPPATLNRQAPRPIAPMLGANNPLNSILAETAQSMAMDDFGNFGGEVMEKDVPIVESIGGMFASQEQRRNLC